jgi:GntR family transcriptional regulator / MocR family aminotransferase
MDIHVNLIGRTDLAGEIYRQLRAAIQNRHLKPGEMLPATRELASRLGVARTTVNIAYERLNAEGFAVSKVGSGTYVTDAVPAKSPVWKSGASLLRPKLHWEAVRIPSELWRPAKYDFRAGVPETGLFPAKTWRRLLSHEFRPHTDTMLYGDPAGNNALRQAIVRHIAISRGIRANAEDVIVTSGTQQAIDLIARVLLNPGECVCVEDPGYGTPRRLLGSLGLQVRGIPVDAEGVMVEAIPREARLIYVSPSHQFPLGMSMSPSRRTALLAWARDNCGAVIEDDYDSEFRFGGRPIEPLHTLDCDGRVIYVGSFSKTMFPGLRLGFVIAPPSLQRAIRSAKYLADWNSPPALQAAMARFIEAGYFARYLRRMRNVYEQRHRSMVEGIKRAFADELEVVPSSVGLHVAAFARSASVERIENIVKRAAERSLECTALSLHAAGERKLAGLVLGYGAIDVNRIGEGLAVLREVFDEFADAL